MQRLKFLPCILIFIIITLPNVAQNKVDYGKHQVGFVSFMMADYSRSYQNQNFRNVQAAVWYPTNGYQSERIQFSEYIRLYLNEDKEFASSEEIENNLKFWRSILSNTGDSVDVDALLNYRSISMSNAEFPAKKYPLILYAAGGQGESFENFILCEALASFGFVVAAIPSLGTYRHEMNIDPMGLASQTRDLELLVNSLHKYEFIDFERIGVMGWSWGGLAAINLQVKNKTIDAVVSLDGSIAGHENKIKLQPYYDINKVRNNYLFFATDESSKERTHDYFNRLKYADANFISFSKIDHSDFNVYNYLGALFSNRKGDKEKNRLNFYPVLINTISDYFRKVLNNSETKFVFAENQSSLISYSDTKKALPKPLDEFEFIELISTNGVEEGKVAYERMKEYDSTYVPFQAFELTKLAFALVRDSIRSNEAVEIMDMVVKEYPKYMGSYSLKGRIHEIRGEYIDALESFSIALGIARNTQEDLENSEKVFYEDPNWFSKKIESFKNTLQNKQEN